MKKSLIQKLKLALLVLVHWTILPRADAVQETWTPTGSMTGARMSHTATFLPNGMVLVAGGTAPIGANLSSAKLYNANAGTWTSTGSMSCARGAGHIATLLANGKVLVAGGYGGAADVSSAEVYDPATGTWTSTGSMSSPRFGHTGTLLTNGKVLVAGGRNGSGNYLSSAALYNPATGTWASTSSMSGPRIGHTATSLTNGKVLVAGGYHGNNLSSAALYDPSTETWASTGSMSIPRGYHTATMLANGTVLVAGGATGSSHYSSAEIYDPATGTWTPTDSMISIHSNHTATMLANGTVLVAGGYGSGAYLSSAEIYDPGTGTWVSAGSMSTRRAFHIATLLADGRVLVAGGDDGSGVTHSSAELYDPKYTLTVGDLFHGQVKGNSSPYFPDSTATLTATADPGYLFTGWTGDVSGATNPLSVSMNANKMIGAVFTPDLSDTDGDCLNNYDEVVIYGTDPIRNDTDGDNLTDSWELGIGRFTVVAGAFTWAQARADAHARGGELACFPTETLWKFALESVGPGGLDNYTGLWIGATDATAEGTWAWVNGEQFNFSLWATGRPDFIAGNTLDFAEVDGGEGAEVGKWYDRSATSTRDGYILETGYSTDPRIADIDGDGLNDGAEQAAGSNPFLADTDDDGFSDLIEVNTGFNPSLAESTPEGNATIKIVPSATPALAEVRFNAANGVRYQIEASADLQTWETVESAIVGQGRVVMRSYSTENLPKRYFRVRRN
jgi:N-acetylneuraminic acid mutarotase